ncbi:MAG TPA: AMP-binding protein [Blastocatellia bacterium]|nr:AMP-binding protein [Blastocatellia bacterium]
MKATDRFNIAEAICKRHADAITRIALLDAKPAGNNVYTYGGLDFISNKFATALAGRGITGRDAVAIILPQSAALITSYFGALKTGAACVELSPSLQKEAIEYALKESRAKAVVADSSIRAEAVEIAGNVNNVQAIFIAGDDGEANAPGSDAKGFWPEIYKASSDFIPVDTESSAPALISYVKGPDGSPREVVRSHASLGGKATAFEMLDDFQINDKGVFRSATDWPPADVLPGFVLPALWHGCAVSIERRDNYSYLSATIGSILVALRAGM